MAKYSKLNRSNSAHLRLRKKYSQLGGKQSYIKEAYHLECFLVQKNLKRVLNKREKKRIYEQSTLPQNWIKD